MAYSFENALADFKDDKINQLANDEHGLRFLKLRSLSRSQHMTTLAENCDLDIGNLPNKNLLRELFHSDDVTNELIHKTINQIFAAERKIRKTSEKDLVSELYKINSFDWGGLHQNSLEKTIVDQYVKKIKSYDVLCESIDNKLYPSMRSYVLCSWYNHWTSIIIEDIFKEHPYVIPAVGLIKKIDFFIHDVPFDLKVTYLPEGFVREKRKASGLRPELTLLKKCCREKDISFDKKLPDARLLEDIWKKIDDHPSTQARELIDSLKKFRDDIVEDCVKDSSELIRWLYENQGVRRFDSSNRTFLIVIKKDDYFNSWQLKRARDLLANEINLTLDSYIPSDEDNILFQWEGQTFKTHSKAIFVIK